MKESIARTLVPLVYALLVKAGADQLGVDDVVLQNLAALIVTGVLYVGLRVAEQHFPAAGVLLGWPKSPTYYTTAPKE